MSDLHGYDGISRTKPEIGAQLQIYFNLHEILSVERTESEIQREEIRER